MLGQLIIRFSLLLSLFACFLVALFWPSLYVYPEIEAASRLAASCDSLDLKSQVAASDGNISCFYGPISDASKRQFLALPMKDGSAIVVESGGGDVAAALDLAEVIAQRHLSIIVNRYCLSSCANYLFPAGKTKIVLNGGVVGFHGTPSITDPVTFVGPQPLHEASQLLEARRRYVRDIQEREARLFFRIGVNPDLIHDRPLTGQVLSTPTKLVWEFGAKTLRDKYRLQDIVYFQTPDHAGLATRLKSLIFGLRCSPAAEDLWVCGRGLLS